MGGVLKRLPGDNHNTWEIFRVIFFAISFRFQVLPDPRSIKFREALAYYRQLVPVLLKK